MATVGELLREARERRQMTLADIADATLINIDFLRAIEQEKFDILPATYVRAFIREYASLVGVDPQTVMQMLDADAQSGTGGAPAPAAGIAPPPRPEPPSPPAGRNQNETGAEETRSQRTIIATVVAVAGIVVVLLWNIMGHEEPAARQIQFQDVVKENERRASPDTARAQAPRTALPAPRPGGDSLALNIHTRATVWLKVTIDKQDYRQVQGRMYRADTTAAFLAKSRFRVTCGNAGAVDLALNGRPLGALGKAGTLVIGVEVNKGGIVVPDSLRRKP